MNICGIVSEYNPFHLGHAHQLAETRKILPDDTAVVSAMSGNFMQRGDFAILDKYKRAEMAICAGIDLVIELPLAAALSSAEGFAKGSIACLHQLGCQTVSFGCENADADFMKAAMLLDSLEFVPSKNISYAAARQNMLRELDAQSAKLLDQPNNTLAISYCSAMHAYGMKPLPILRKGAAHDATVSQNGFASASFIRNLLYKDAAQKAKPFLPQTSFSILMQAIQNGEAPIKLPSENLLFLLRKALYNKTLSIASSDGFAERVSRSIYTSASYEEIITKTATKRFPAARVRRTLLRAALGIPPDAPVLPQYIRVLGFNEKGRKILKNAKTNLPIITKPVSEKKLASNLQPMLSLDAFADDIFALALPNQTMRSGGTHFQKTPYFYEK